MKKVLKTLALMGINVVLAVSSLSPCALTAEAAELSTEISEEIIVSEEEADDVISGEGDKTLPEETLPEEALPEEVILEESYEDPDEEIILEEEAADAEDSEDADFTADNKCGEKATWSFDSKKGALVIKGSGSMSDYTKEEPAPWYGYRDKIKTITIGSGITRIGNYAFLFAGNAEMATGVLVNISIPDTVTEIGEGSFYGCKFENEYHTFTIPDTVTKLGKESFCSFNIGSSATHGDKYIGGTIIIGKGIKTIPEECFRNAVAVNLVIPEGVERIEKKGLYSFFGPYDIVFPSTLKYIDESGCAYWGSPYHVTFFRNITFKGDMPQLADKAFDAHVSCVTYPAGNSTYTAKSIEKARKTFYGSTWRPSDYKITHKAGENITWSRKTVKSGSQNYKVIEFTGSGPMYDYSLDDLPEWYSDGPYDDVIRFDSRITSIGNYAFFEFRNINNSSAYPLEFPSKLDRIGDWAFRNCNLAKIKLPEEVTYVGDNAFYGCRVAYQTTGSFPKKIKYLGDYGLPSGLEMTVDLSGIEHIGRGAMSGSNRIITSPVLPDTLKYIGPYAFGKNTSLSGKLVIPDTVTFVGEKAFSGCSNLTGAVELMGVTSIENQVFAESGITEVTYGSKVATVNVIPNYKFSEALTKVTFNNRYFEGMEDIFSSLNKSGQKITVYYPGAKGWPTDLYYPNLTFTSFGNCLVTFVYPDGHQTVKTVAKGKKASAPTDVKLAEGVSVVGWFTQDKLVKSLQWDFNAPVNMDMTLYAKTTDYECTLRFVGPRSMDVPGYLYGRGEQRVKYGEKAKRVNVGMKGGRFRGWFYDEALTSPFDFDKPVTEDMTVYSKWEKVEVVDFSKDADRLSYEKDLYMEFTGRKKRLDPVIRVKYADGYDTLTEWVDYKIEAVNYYTSGSFTNVGDYILKVKGQGPDSLICNYTGELVITQHITPVDISTSKRIGFQELTGDYTGSVIKLSPYIWLINGEDRYPLTKGEDYTVEYVDADKPGYFRDPGVYQIKITGMGNLKGEMILTETITGKKPSPDPEPDPTPDPEPEPVPAKVKSIAKAKVTGLQNFVFDGRAHNDQKLVVKDGDKILTEGIHYTLEWSNYVLPGTGKVVVKGIQENGYKGKKTLTFKIAKADMKDVAVVEMPKNVTYTKGGTTPAVKVYFRLYDGEYYFLDKNLYKVSYRNNTKVNDGTGKKVPTVVITGKKYFKGTVKETFKIVPSSITNCTATAKDVKYKKGKGNYKSKIVVRDSNGKKLTAGKDYDAKNMVFTVQGTGKVLAKNDTVAADTTIVVKIKGLGNYASGGTISCTYKITK